MSGRSFPLKSLRHRMWGTLGMLALGAVAVAAAAFAPLYARSVGQAALHSALSHAGVSARGLAVSENGSDTNPAAALRGVDRRLYGPAQTATEIQVMYRLDGRPVQGSVVNRSGQCAHLQLVSGRCPVGDTEVAASASAARALHLRVGSRITVTAQFPGSPEIALPVTVIGVYAVFQAATPYWFDHAYCSTVGADAVAVPGGDGNLLQADALFTGPGFFHEFGRAVADPAFATDAVPAIRSVELPLLPDRIGLDQEAALRRGLSLTGAAAARSGGQTGGGLSGLLRAADDGRDEAGRIIPAFATELALVVIVALAVVVQSATDDRRAQIALARLRGHTGRSATRAVLWEMAPVGLAGLVLGSAAAWGAAHLADRWWLGGHGGPELRWAPVGAAVAVFVAQSLFTWFVVRRATTRPVQDLLRGVPPSSRRSATVLEVSVAALALGGVVVTVSGDRRTLLGLATPALLALVTGLMLARIAVPVARRVGGRLFWRKPGATAYAALQFARRPGMRRVVAVACVASAIAVSACIESVVASDNRAARADVQAGAGAVLSTDATNITRLRRAVDRADPSGSQAAVVVTQNPPNGPAVLAVDSRRFAAVARWGTPADRPAPGLLARLTPTLPPAVTITGSQLQLRLADVRTARSPNPIDVGVAGPAYLQAELTPTGGEAEIVQFGQLPDADTTQATVSAAVPCARGCRVTGLSLRRTPSDVDQLRFSADLTATAIDAGARSAVALGTASSWASVDGTTPTAFNTPDSIALTQHGTTLRLTFVNANTATELQQLTTPIAVPALATTDLDDSVGVTGRFLATGIQGLAVPFDVVDRLPFLPGAGHPQLIVDLGYAEQVSATTAASAGTAAVWLGSEDAGLRRRVVDALDVAGVHVTRTDSAGAHRAVLDATAPATAMRLAFVTAGLAVLLAGIVLVLTVLASARARRADQVALRAIGARARDLVRGTAVEQLFAVVLGVVAGVAVGLLGVALTFDAVPIFVHAAGFPPIRRTIPTEVVLATAAIALLALAVLAATVAALTAARPGRDAETEA